MIIEQIYTKCLSEAAYYIESEGEVAIIDPLRDTNIYIDKAKQNGAKIKYVLETHFHADFVSGHLDLAARTGAQIVYGPNAITNFPFYQAEDLEELKLGNCTLKVLHTPGHTLESTSYLLKDNNKKDIAIFTGDTLFIGDVGRPDLAVKSDLSENDLAGILYDSLHNKIMPLADDVIVYPAHGAGSACGKSLSKETTDSLGNQKHNNYALKFTNKQEFIDNLIDGILPPPQYFPKNALINKQGYESLNTVQKRGMTVLDIQEFITESKQSEVLILDTRNAQVFAKGFVPKAVNIGLDGQFAPWVGALITNINQPILLVADTGTEIETITRLARVGYDHSIGYLKGGFETWKNANLPFDTIKSISPKEFIEINQQQKINILDVRKAAEFEKGHVNNSVNHPLDDINIWSKNLDKNQTYYVHCGGGYRSMIAASMLKKDSFGNILDIQGGYGAIEKGM